MPLRLHSTRRATLVLTAGDPCGIGPEVILKSLGRMSRAPVRLVVIGDLSVFARLAKRLRRPLPAWTVVFQDSEVQQAAHRVVFFDQGRTQPFRHGCSSREAGQTSVDYLDAAVRLVRGGIAQALVTGPVTKASIQAARGQFEGQTEYLAEAFGARRVVMAFVSDQLRVALVTRHVSLSAVSGRLTQQLLSQTITQTADGLARWFGIRAPRLAICGLNPHAGEGGLFGQEERTVFLPVLQRLRRQGFKLEGPLAADGLFSNAPRYDAVICGYHDQGLIPFKLMSRDRGCQLSFGLPIVRTSPDHGSALDIAGKGRAHPGSMRYALQLASRLILRPARPLRTS